MHPDMIESIIITRYDSLWSETRMLRPISIKSFTDRWNASKKAGTSTSPIKYTLDVYCKDDTLVNFSCSEGEIKTINGDCYIMGDTKYFDQIWNLNKTVCPRGHTNYIIPIIYGLPTLPAVERSRRNEILLGGCIIEEHAPNWYCRLHKLSFGELPLN